MKKVWRWLGAALTAALVLVGLAGLYVTLVVAQPQPREREDRSQPPLTASPARRISAEAELRELVAAFPAPVMSFMSGSRMVFVSGESADRAYGEKLGRVLNLYWQTEAGEPLILQSIYPADALELIGKGDYTFSAKAGPALFGQRTVRMENGSTLRIHAQVAGTGLYALTVPGSLEGSLSEIARSIQLFTSE